MSRGHASLGSRTFGLGLVALSAAIAMAQGALLVADPFRFLTVDPALVGLVYPSVSGGIGLIQLAVGPVAAAVGVASIGAWSWAGRWARLMGCALGILAVYAAVFTHPWTAMPLLALAASLLLVAPPEPLAPGSGQ